MWRSWRGMVVAVGVALPLGGCDSFLAPDPAPPPSVPPRPALAAQGTLADTSVLIPPFNEPYKGSVGPDTVPLPMDSVWTRITVVGKIAVGTNPAWTQVCSTRPAGSLNCPPPYTGRIAGPDGIPNADQGATGLRVKVRAEAIVSGRPWGRDLYFTADGIVRSQEYVWLPPRSTVTVSRTGIYGHGDGVPHYTLAGMGPGGTQRLVIERVPTPLDVKGPANVAPGASATFEAVPHTAMTAYKWWAYYGDTLAAPKNPPHLGSTTGGTRLWACDGLLTCTFVPTAGGRLYVEARTPSYDYPRAFTQPFRVHPQLELSCPDTVVRSSTVSCTASARPSTAPLVVLEWTFRPDSSGTVVQHTGDLKAWSFRAAECGSVTVRALVAGVEQSRQARVTVCEFLPAATGDPVLDDPDVQAYFRQLWKESNPKDPGPNRVERGGFLTEKDGTHHFIPYQGPSTRCTSESGSVTIPAGHTVVAFVHTHPDNGGTPVPADGSCRGNTDPSAVFDEGPSDLDRKSARALRRFFNRKIPGYIIDPDDVHRFGGDLPSKSFNRSPSCS